MRLTASLAWASWLLASTSLGLDPTDTIMDGDSQQSGYAPDHNIDPAILTGGSFGQIWRYTTPPTNNGASEQFYAKPLVYTPSSTGRQVVLSFSEQNRMFILDAVNGTLYASRDLAKDGESPFLVSDLGGCNDISGTVGITGTPVIDPSTDTVYFWAKAYLTTGYTVTGWQNGAYYFHAVDAVTLQERPGFPVNIQGQTADNDHRIYFTGGNVLQRTGLNLINNVVYAGFGGHCDQYNYTGWVVGMSTAGKYITGYATTGGDGAPPQDGTWSGGGGGSGVWMSGSAISSDNSGRLFYATGNGFRSRVNQDKPSSGRTHLDTLSECMVNMRVEANGSLVQQDWFETYEYLAMDAGDRDLGSGGVALLDPSVFSGGGVLRIAVTVGKNGKAYVANADNLGGYKLGPSGTDNIIQTLSMPGGGSVFGIPGSYPLEGGWIYITPVGYATQVYSLGFTSAGLPSFTKVAQTNDSSAGRVGVGPATVTTFKGQPGTGVLWVVDVDAGVRAYHAVPVNGQMVPIPLPASPSVNKFQRPAFGNGRFYLSTSNGNILAFGSPVALPLNCTSPVNYGSVTIGNTSTMTINCTALIPITSLNGFVLGKSIFQAQNSSLPKGALKVGQSFSFPVVFNLTGYSLSSGSSSAPAVSPGVQTTSIGILTTNGVTGYSTEQPITLTGTSVSAAPFIYMTPLQVDFQGITLGSVSADAGSDATFVIQNVGQSPMKILNVTWTDDAVNPDPGEDAPTFYPVTSTTDDDGTVVYILDDDNHFTATNLPKIGDVIAPGQQIVVPLVFKSDEEGDFYTTVYFTTDGGKAYSTLVGSASTLPVALLEVSTNEGGWTTIPDCNDECVYTVDFGTITGVGESTRTLRFTNTGGSGLTITKSKPPEGDVMGAQNPNTDLSEGLTIPPDDDATGIVYFSPGNRPLNSDPVVYSVPWTLNTDDLTFGIHVINFTGVSATKQVGPLSSTGSAIFKYLGCYQDNTNGVRIEPKSINNNAMDNGLCQNTAQTAGVIFAATEYQVECWYGSAVPSAQYKVADSKCSYACGGDANQSCGGNGGYMSLYYDSTRYNPNTGSVGSGASSSTLAAAGTSTSSAASSSTSTAAGTSTVNVASSSTSVVVGTSTANPAGTSSPVVAGTSTSIAAGTSTATTSAAATSSSAVTGPGNLKNVSGYGYAGCWSDAAGARVLNLYTVTSNTMTVEACAKACSGYSIFGTEYADECYCGSTLAATSIQEPEADCNMACVGSASEWCGGAARMSLYTLGGLAPNATTPAVPNGGAGSNPTGSIVKTVGNFSYVGCYSDATNKRTLTALTTTSNTMTIETCAAFCQAYSYFGTEYSKECYCSNSLTAGSALVTDGRCNMACAGNNTEICGGAAGLTLYQYVAPVASNAPQKASTTTAVVSSSSAVVVSVSSSSAVISSIASSSTVVASVSSSSSLAVASTTLSTLISSTTPVAASSSTSPVISSTPIASVTPSSSASPSSSAIPATSSIPASSVIPSSSIASTTPVAVVSSTSSSAASATPTAPTIPAQVGLYSYIECHSDNTTIRTLSASKLYANTMTIEACQTFCAGSTYFGVEYGAECYCGNTLSQGSYAATDGRCNMKCAGSASEICGGPSGLTLYQLTSTIVKPVVDPWKYVGCANDTSGSRALSAAAYTDNTGMTIESCKSYCLSQNYPLAGVEFGTECYCGMGFSFGSTTGYTDCLTPCSGNATETCGGVARLNVYNYTSYIAPSILPAVGTDFKYYGCYTDSTANRVLPATHFANSTGMTEEMCVNYCSTKSYAYAGIEYGQECWCDNTLGATSTKVSDSQCQVKFCPGNSREYCGDGARMVVFRNGTAT